jgi:hypothetical protein
MTRPRKICFQTTLRLLPSIIDYLLPKPPDRPRQLFPCPLFQTQLWIRRHLESEIEPHPGLEILHLIFMISFRHFPVASVLSRTVTLTITLGRRGKVTVQTCFRLWHKRLALSMKLLERAKSDRKSGNGVQMMLRVQRPTLHRTTQSRRIRSPPSPPSQNGISLLSQRDLHQGSLNRHTPSCCPPSTPNSLPTN